MKRYIVTEGSGKVRRVYRTWGDKFADMGKWGWNAVRFHDVETEHIVWIRKYWMVEVEELPIERKQ